MRRHHGQGDVPQLLKPVFDAVQAPRLVILAIYGVETGPQGEEGGAQADPQLYDDDHHHHILGIPGPLDGIAYQPHFQQDAVEIPVNVPVKDDEPDGKHRIGQGGRVKHHRQDGAPGVPELVDHPREEQTQQIAQRPHDDGQQEGVLHGGQKDRIVEKQLDVVLKAQKTRGLKDVIGREAQPHGHDHRPYREGEKHQQEGEHQQVSLVILFQIGEMRFRHRLPSPFLSPARTSCAWTALRR